MEPFALLVGLGNPGARYESTRHNAGFWFAEAAARRLHAQFRPEKRFQGRVAEGAWNGGKVRLLMPDTYMNHSGRSVGALAGFFKIQAERVLVAHDEIDLPPGTVRLKTGGGHGGHNGLRDIIGQLGSPEFTRLRIGVGHPGLADDVVDYVLNRPGKAEQAGIEASIDAACGVLPEILDGDLPAAMRVLHTKPKA
ncbi:MAG: aminoacyl-tRNA hydrolase [Gammaproteobacteria bacterium]|nr:aminoacyl-tRNA hydrolase [Gammaproteobacteria bacterium]